MSIKSKWKAAWLLILLTALPLASQSVDMVFVEGGKFLMGCRNDRDGIGRDRCPSDEELQVVEVENFYISKYEVSNELWHEVMETVPPKMNYCSNCPVDNKNYREVKRFIRKLNKKTGVKYRLPTDNEWEYAGRGGNKSKGFKYAGSNKIEEVGWFLWNSTECPNPIGLKKPNELGLYDMSGNVMEWCKNLYSFEEALFNIYRAVKGGSVMHLPSSCRLATRFSFHPSSGFGFRLAMSLR